MKAVIMAAGKSTRTYPLTLTRPKPLLKAANRSILEWQLKALTGIVDEVLIVVHYRQELIRQQFGAAYGDLKLTYVEQQQPLGTGHAILQCAGRLEEPFLAMNGDDLYDPDDLRALAAGGRNAAADGCALVRHVPDPSQSGIYEVTDGDRVVRIVEKPKEVFSTLANVGAYRFTPRVFEVLRSTPLSERGEIEITSAIQTLADTGDFRVVETTGYWIPISYPWSLLDANEFLLRTQLQPRIEGEVSSDAHVRGVVSVGRGTTVRPGAVIDGPVSIGANCAIGPNCWLRPGTSVGNGCRVGQAVEIKNSIIMDGAFVCHLSYVGDSIIGENANLGAGTILANVRHDGGTIGSMVKGKLVDSGRQKLGAIIGDRVHTGIHTSVYPGRKLWPGTSTRPGEIVQNDLVA